MEKEICTVEIGDGFLDNDYTFYESGNVYHKYDRNVHRLNLEEWTEVGNISDRDKKKILARCLPEHLDYFTEILKKN